MNIELRNAMLLTLGRDQLQTSMNLLIAYCYLVIVDSIYA